MMKRKIKLYKASGKIGRPGRGLRGPGCWSTFPF